MTKPLSRRRFSQLPPNDLAKMIELSRDYELSAKDIADRFRVNVKQVQTHLIENGLGHGPRSGPRKRK